MVTDACARRAERVALLTLLSAQLPGFLLYLLGFAGEVFVLTSVYLVMPAGRLHWRHALIGGVVWLATTATGTGCTSPGYD